MYLRIIFTGLLLIVFLIEFAYANSSGPLLTILYNNKTYHYSRSKLLNTPAIEQITMDNNRAYPGRRMTLSSIKLCTLLKSYPIQPNDMLEFIATDQFAVYIPAIKILTCETSSSIAYLAIEPQNKWPLINNGTGTTAGPFAVIWIHPEKSYISNEYWAWSVNKIVVHKQLDKATLKLKPAIANQSIKHGFNVYISHCAGCHTINHIGKGVIGPDLNDPKNPVEYYPNDAMLKQFIRDPQSIRKIKNDRMAGSGEDFLSDPDLADLITYFHYMVNHK